MREMKFWVMQSCRPQLIIEDFGEFSAIQPQELSKNNCMITFKVFFGSTERKLLNELTRDHNLDEMATWILSEKGQYELDLLG